MAELELTQDFLPEARFRVLICGGRDITDQNYVYHWLELLFHPSYNDLDGHAGTWLPRPDLTLILGGAKGVDSIAEEWAVVNWVDHKVYPADWEKYGRAAGPIRNQQMLDEGKPMLGVAFRGGRGTAHMVSIMKAAKVPVLEIP